MFGKYASRVFNFQKLSITSIPISIRTVLSAVNWSRKREVSIFQDTTHRQRVRISLAGRSGSTIARPVTLNVLKGSIIPCLHITCGSRKIGPGVTERIGHRDGAVEWIINPDWRRDITSRSHTVIWCGWMPVSNRSFPQRFFYVSRI